MAMLTYDIRKNKTYIAYFKSYVFTDKYVDIYQEDEFAVVNLKEKNVQIIGDENLWDICSDFIAKRINHKKFFNKVFSLIPNITSLHYETGIEDEGYRALFQIYNLKRNDFTKFDKWIKKICRKSGQQLNCYYIGETACVSYIGNRAKIEETIEKNPYIPITWVTTHGEQKYSKMPKWGYYPDSICLKESQEVSIYEGDESEPIALAKSFEDAKIICDAVNKLRS